MPVDVKVRTVAIVVLARRRTFLLEVPDMLARVIRRVADEESVKKLVIDTFCQACFSPERNAADVSYNVSCVHGTL